MENSLSKSLRSFLGCYLITLSVFSQTHPSLEFTSVPEWGKSSGLTGRIHYADPENNAVAIYIFVEEAGGWWNKPLAAQPLTAIAADSTFSADIVTGGLDQYATRIIAYLVPRVFHPPILNGGELPSSLLIYPFTLHCRPHGDRVINWSGLTWTVKRSVGTQPLPIGPGPNIFVDNDSMVWVGSDQKLHLRLARDNNHWYCTEVICNESQGYNRYNFRINTRIDLLDPNIIAGLFLWDDSAPYAAPPDPYYREVDIEFSRWGLPENDYAQFVVQPYQVPGNMDRFSMDLSGTGFSDHFIHWSADSLVFRSEWGENFHQWKFLKKTMIPVPGNETVRINFHLLFGSPPANMANAEFVLDHLTLTANNNVARSGEMRCFPNPFRDHFTLEIPSDVHKTIFFDLISPLGSAVIETRPLQLHPGLNRIVSSEVCQGCRALPEGFYLVRISGFSFLNYQKLIKL